MDEDGQIEAAAHEGVVHRDCRRLGNDAFDQVGQDLARSDLDEGVDAVGRHGLDRADPVDARGEVLDELRLATPKTPCLEARATSSGMAASSRPRIAAIAPSRPEPLACMRSPRSRTRRTPSGSESALAATIAEYWPMEWPA